MSLQDDARPGQAQRVITAAVIAEIDGLLRGNPRDHIGKSSSLAMDEDMWDWVKNWFVDSLQGFSIMGLIVL